MEKERANEKKIGGQEEGRKKKSEGDQYFLLLSLLFLFRGLLLLFLGVFLISFSVGIRGGGARVTIQEKNFLGRYRWQGSPSICAVLCKRISICFLRLACF